MENSKPAGCAIKTTESQVQEQFGHSDRAIERTAHLISELESRLGPILRASAPRDEDEKLENCLVEVASVIRRQRKSVEMNNEAIDDILSRIEV